MTKVTATEAARSFSEIVSRVRYRHEIFVVERNGEPVCQIRPVAEGDSRATVKTLLDLLRRTRGVDPSFAADLAAIQRRQPRLPRSPWDS